eukprot:CAMPEP_0177292452 /NCGR_PEP_ID=MMETSP0368-20130122/184_1 /TAXON_ID=447022 ORGANISM="Scrippsiella hangoei-like, Strain SHHI-4" /NCGR_SAMPLE_ID=MMETSP0368 /ASSEMBLY_ACC=CAM_ASM_000363 /LENGTH=40 /DNA_ID= /DNA_START= /DNA_END= /DNA_ORIENTATION=
MWLHGAPASGMWARFAGERLGALCVKTPKTPASVLRCALQ